MSEEVTNSTPLVTRVQHQTLLDASEVVTHLADEAREDLKVGRAPEGVDRDLDMLASKLFSMAMMLEMTGMVSEG
jgi:hypothetical protein